MINVKYKVFMKLAAARYYRGEMDGIMQPLTLAPTSVGSVWQAGSRRMPIAMKAKDFDNHLSIGGDYGEQSAEKGRSPELERESSTGGGLRPRRLASAVVMR